MTALLTTESLGKAFSERAGLAHTVARRLLRFGRAPVRFPVFENISFALAPGECVALEGGNGSGKSTFLRCLAGVLAPTRGSVHHHGRVAALLSHGFGAYEDLPVWKNILLAQQLLGAGHREASSQTKSVAEMAGLSDRLFSPTSHLSEGMRAKIGLSALAHSHFQVALLDESLNHVDKEYRSFFFGLTRKWIAEGRSLVLTSHDEQVLHEFATRRLRFEGRALVAVE